MPSKKEEIKDIEKRINFLENKLAKANIDYYIKDKSKLLDSEYDKLYRELLTYSKNYPNFFNNNSVLNKVGADTTNSELKEITHMFPMLSLENAKDNSEIIKWVERTEKNLESKTNYLLEHKFDGAAISLTYKDGKLVLAATRGNGKKGENITENAFVIKNIPKKIELKEEVEIRGEILIRKKDFIKLNKDQESKELATFSNPRNAASGSVRQLDTKITASRPLRFYAYNLVSKNKLFNKQSEIRKYLKDTGFDVSKPLLVSAKASDIVKCYELEELRRDELEYEIDGLVLKVDSLEIQEELGSRSKSPRWAVALKFKPGEAVSIVNDISIQVGRTGAITPVAELNPVSISGVIVSRATLHNKDEIERKDIRIGDSVIVKRQGDVIPAVTSVLLDKRTDKEKKYIFPNTCPECNGNLEKIDAVTYCINNKCPAKLIQSLEHFVSKNAFNIEGLGTKLINKLYTDKLINDFSDILNLKKDDLMKLERMGDKLSENILSEIEKSKNISFSRFIYALGIRHIGVRSAEILAQNFDSIEKLSNAKIEDLEKVNDIGPKVSESIKEYFSNNIEQLEELESLCIFSHEEKLGNKLESKTFVITGSFENESRDDLKKFITSQGGKVTSSISKKTSYLVLGKDPGSKHEKAKKLGIDIINITRLKELV